MDSKGYLKSYGWVEGEPLTKNGLRKPILVKHKKDTKGLGHDSKEGDVWWERVFDGLLKGLDVMGGGSGNVVFKQNEIKVSGMKERDSPLYKMFVKGEGLAGTVGETKHVNVKQEIVVSEVNRLKSSFDKGGVKKEKKVKKGKKEGKVTKKRSEDKKDKNGVKKVKEKVKKVKRDKKEKEVKGKKEKKEKKEKRDKRSKKEKREKVEKVSK